MIPELGHVALIIALCLSVVQSIVPLLGAQLRITPWIAVAKPLAQGQLIFVAISFACLAYAFMTHDFTVAYVANNSNTALPTMYLFSAIWGAHEGSLLLWALVLSVWSGFVTVFSRVVPESVLARVIAVLGMVSVGFLLFMLLTSNPFGRCGHHSLERI